MEAFLTVVLVAGLVLLALPGAYLVGLDVIEWVRGPHPWLLRRWHRITWRWR